MARWQVFVVCLGCFVAGAASQSAIAQRNRLTFSEDLHVGKDPRAAARSLLDGALELADNGSWERIAVVGGISEVTRHGAPATTPWPRTRATTPA